MVVLIIFHITLTWHLLLIPLYAALALIVILAFCVWLAPLNIRYRDVTHILPFIVQITLYTSPVFYPISLIPASVRWIYSLNPITTVVQGFRWCVLSDSIPPDFAPAVIGFTILITILVFGLAFFKRSELTFVDNI